MISMNPLRQFFVAVVCLFTFATSAAAEGEIKWFNDLRQASAAAQEANKPMMIEFGADWCGPCKIMESQVYTDVRVPQGLTQQIIAVRIHCHIQTDFVRKYNVEAIPYIVFANSFGTEMLH